ncbi:MAG: lectin-like protein, partial [Fuerstiella sp.]
SSYVHGAGGTILAQAVNPRATSTANPQVDIKLAAGSLVRAARDIDITAVSAGNMAASTEAYGGAIISQARADATSQSDHSAIVQLYGNVHATEHLTVESKISDAGEAHSDTKSYGALTATAKSNAWVRQAFTSKIETDQGARLFAGDSIELNAYSYLSDQMSSRTQSGALFGVSKANQGDDSGIEIEAGDDTKNKNTTEIVIGQASLVADEVYLTAKVLGVDTDPDDSTGEVVEAYGNGMQNANQATGQVTFVGTAEISLEDRARIVGDKIEIFAILENLDLYTKAHTRRGRAASRPNVEVTYTGTSTVTSSPGATVVTENLLVQAEQLISDDDFHAKIKSDRGDSDEEPDNKIFDLTANREIQWDATVLGREEARLEVDTDGTILVAEGVQLDRYQYVNTNFTYEQAQADAQSRGGRLVTIRSEQEQQLLKDFIAPQAGVDSFWIGASDEGHEGVWKWLEDEEQDVTFWTQTGDELFWTGGALGNAVDNAYTNWAPVVQVIDQSAELEDFDGFIPNLGQSFQPGAGNVSGASVKLSLRVGGQADVSVELHSASPATPETLLASATVDGVSTGDWATVFFDEPVSVDPDSTYYLIFSASRGNFYGSELNPYPQGQLLFTNGTPSLPGRDLAFRTFTEWEVGGPVGIEED